MSYMKDSAGNRLDDIAIKDRLDATDAAMPLKAEKSQLSLSQACSDVLYPGGTFAGNPGIPVMIDGMYAVAPPSDRPQFVRYSTAWNITVVGNGTFTLSLYELTGGAAVLKNYEQEWVSASRPVTALGNRMRGEYRVDPHTDWKVFQTYFTLLRDAGSSLQMGVPMNGNEYAKLLCEVFKE